MKDLLKPQLIKIPSCKDERGDLFFFEIDKILDFDIKRVYFITNIPQENQIRGQHAHKNLRQFMVAVGGKIEITLDDGNNKLKFDLNSSDLGLYVPSGLWRDVKFKDKNASLFVFASDIYQKDDYIKNYEDFLKLSRDSI